MEPAIYEIGDKAYYQKDLGALQTVEILLLLEGKDVAVYSDGKDWSVGLDAFGLLKLIRPNLAKFLGTVLIPQDKTPEQFAQMMDSPVTFQKHCYEVVALVPADRLLEVAVDFLERMPTSSLAEKLATLIPRVQGIIQSLSQLLPQTTSDDISTHSVPSSEEETQEPVTASSH